MSSLLNIGTSALNTAQTSLATTSHNISNVNTDGYTRQRTTQAANTPNQLGSNYVGSGVSVSSVERVYSGFLANQVRSYTSQEAQDSSFLTYSQQVDDMLGSDEMGISGGLDDFFNAIQEVANDPSSVAARQVMLTQTGLLANRFNTLDNQLTLLDQQIDSDLRVAIDDINNLSQGIAELNAAIVAATTSNGVKPNDLLDQREQMLNQLSEYVSVNTVMEDSGALNVFIGSGQALVVGVSQVNLSALTDTSTDPARVAVGYGASQIDITAFLSGGSVGGALQVRSDVIDTTRAELDSLADSIVSAFNNQHTTGVDLDGVAGGNLFDPAGITAGDINVIITDPRKVAASSTVNPGVGNNENALALANLQTDNTTVVVNPGPPAVTRSFDDQYGVIVSDVATRTRQAEVSQETQQSLLDQTTARYESVSGVNLDEEAANLIKYQQAYQAASQIISATKTLFDALISVV